MARNLTSSMLAKLTSNSLILAFACEIDTISGNNVYVWSGQGTLTPGSGPLSGKSFLGIAGFYSVSAVQESANPMAIGIKLSLNGVDASLLGTALSDLNQGKPAYLWLLVFNDDGTLVDDPYMVFAGTVDLVQADIDSSKAVISVSVENALIDLKRPRLRRYTPEDQAIDYPSDAGFNCVAQLQQATVSWGVPGGIPTWSDTPLAPGFIYIELLLLLIGWLLLGVSLRYPCAIAGIAVGQLLRHGLELFSRRTRQWKAVVGLPEF